jgi:AAA domain
MANYFVFGLAGTGKDTFAYLMEKHYDVHSVALADAIRQEYVHFLDKDDYKTNRQMMINIGQTYKLLYGQDVWCRAAEKEFPWNDDRLIKDGRYEHEYHYFVMDRGYIPIRLVADDEIRFERLKRRDGNTQREALQYEKANFIPDGYDAINVNTNGTVEQLEEIVRGLFK